MKKVKNIHIVLFGLLIGAINGFFGGGGGMIVVPLLTKAFNMPQKNAQATAIFVILPISIASSIIYITKNSINFSKAWTVILGVILGGIAGAILLNKLKNNIIKIVFVSLMLIGGINLLFF